MVATPEFILALRAQVGTAALPLVGVTVVVVRDGQLLLGRRADDGALAPVMGIVEPGEEPADTAVREAAEEAGVQVQIERLAWVHQTPRLTYPNGDIADFLDLTFRCSWVAGVPRPVDGELTEVGWYLPDALSEVSAEHRGRIDVALQEGPTRFDGGR